MQPLSISNFLLASHQQGLGAQQLAIVVYKSNSSFLQGLISITFLLISFLFVKKNLQLSKHLHMSRNVIIYSTTIHLMPPPHSPPYLITYQPSINSSRCIPNNEQSWHPFVQAKISTSLVSLSLAVHQPFTQVNLHFTLNPIKDIDNKNSSNHCIHL